MLSELGSLIFYIVVIALCAICLKSYERNKKRKFLLLSSYYILFTISVIRYDIGNDYSGYAELIPEIIREINKNGLWAAIVEYLWTDVAIVLISSICSWMSHPFLGWYFIISMIEFCLLYNICKNYDIHKLGVLFFIISGYLFILWDGARQGVSIIVFLYSFRYIEERKLTKYLLCMTVATLFHKSSIFLLPVYCFSYFNLKGWIYELLIFILLLIYWSGAVDSIQTNAIDLLSYSGDYYSKYSNPNLSANEGITSVSFKLRTTLKILCWSLALYFTPKGKDYLKSLLFLGVFFAIIGNGSLTIMRISWYFQAAGIVALPLAYKYSSAIWRFMIYLFLTMMFLVLCRDIYGIQNNGCTPFETVFSSNFEKGKFRPDRW